MLFVGKIVTSLLIASSVRELVVILKEFLDRLFGHGVVKPSSAVASTSSSASIVKPAAPLPYSSPLKDSYAPSGGAKQQSSLSGKALQWPLSPSTSSAALLSPSSPVVSVSSPLASASSSKASAPSNTNLLSSWNVNLNSFLSNKSNGEDDSGAVKSNEQVRGDSSTQQSNTSLKPARQSAPSKIPFVRQELTPEMVRV